MENNNFIDLEKSTRMGMAGMVQHSLVVDNFVPYSAKFKFIRNIHDYEYVKKECEFTGKGKDELKRYCEEFCLKVGKYIRERVENMPKKELMGIILNKEDMDNFLEEIKEYVKGLCDENDPFLQKRS